MDAKHTPGPWIVGDRLVGGQLPVGPHDRMRVANVPLYAPIAGVNGTSGEIEANARLIAAAPLLLTMLRRLSDEIRMSERGMACVAALTLEQVDAAIRSVEG